MVTYNSSSSGEHDEKSNPEKLQTKFSFKGEENVLIGRVQSDNIIRGVIGAGSRGQD